MTQQEVAAQRQTVCPECHQLQSPRLEVGFSSEMSEQCPEWRMHRRATMHTYLVAVHWVTLRHRSRVDHAEPPGVHLARQQCATCTSVMTSFAPGAQLRQQCKRAASRENWGV